MRIEKFLQTNPLFSLYVCYDRILGDFQKRLRGERVHFLQALILTGIFFEERPVRPSELAATLHATRPNISHALRALERQGWIERHISAGDARAYLFNLTRDGRRKIPRLIKIFDSVQDQIEKANGGKRIGSQLQSFAEIYRQIQMPK